MKINKKQITNWLLDNVQIIVFAVLVIAMLAIFGVAIIRSATQPKEGVVIRKDYFPEYTTTTYKTIYQSNNKTTRIPVEKYHPARYQITIKGINSKGKEDFGYYDVTPAEYVTIEIGDYYIKQRD